MEREELNIFQPISLSEMNEAALMKRTDTKFLVKITDLPAILSFLKDSYKVLQVGDDRLMTYDSVYYDTPDSNFYYMHHNGLAHRVKVRIRKYVESNLSYLEVKQKDSYGNTIKNRIKVGDAPQLLKNEFHQFVCNTTGQDFELLQSISNRFNRFTLVRLDLKERVTFDTNLAFDGHTFYPGLAIVELKQARLNRNSQLYTTLKAKGIHPYSISKYCMGMAANSPELKQNKFKPKFIKITKLVA